MEFGSMTNGFLVSAALATAALAAAVSARADVATSAVAPSAMAQFEPEPGELILNATCQECHDLRRVQTKAMDPAGWTTTIHKMIENGAKLSKEDMPVLVSYLAFRHGPLPDGPGKSVLLNTCTMCHDLGRIKFGKRSAEEWEETLVSMLNEGAPLNDAEFDAVHHYLSENFGAD